MALLASHPRQAVVYCDARRLVQWVNPAFERLSGYSMAEAVGRSPAELVQCPQTDPGALQRMKEALGRGEGIRVELLNQAKDGRRYWIDADISPVHDSEGSVCGYIAFEADITEQVHLRHRLQAIFEGAGTGMVVQDSDGRITDANAEAQRLLGRTREQLMALDSVDPRWQAVREDLSPFAGSAHPALQTLRDGVGRRDVVMGITGPDGERRWLQINSEPVPMARAASRSVISSFVDITQRKRNDEILAEAIEAIPDGFVVYDEHDRLLICNSAYRRTYERSSPAMVPGVRFESLLRYGIAHGQYPQAGDNLASHEAWIADRMAAHRRHDNETLQQLAGDRWVQIRERRTPAGYTVGVRTDVTDLKRTQQALLTSQSKLQSLFNLAPVGIVLNRLDDGMAVECNDALLAMLGYRRDDLQTVTFRTVTPPEYRQSEYAQLASLQTTGRYGPYEKELFRKDGSRVPVLLNGMCLEDSDGGMLIWSIVQDISARKAMERELSQAARTDLLTGLANRTALTERLVTAVQAVKADPSRRFSLLFLDFDRFKLVNDTLGHHAGDRLLCEIARRLRRNLRASDFAADHREGNVVARLGGDEFVLLLKDARDEASAQAVARRVLEALAPAYLILGHEVYSSASIGIALADESTESADSLLRDADIAMYEAKHAGRACAVVFNGQMHLRLTRRIELENGLRRALGTAQLSLVYQPIVDLDSGEMVSVEALARWQHPVLGAISPAEFIPVAEETGLILPLGEWVLRESCRQFMAWRFEAGERAPRTISVNLSRVQMNSPDQLRALLRDVLAVSGMQAEWLQLEVTEREVMRDPQASRSLMLELRGIGVRLAMDDFGTGTSSLGCLREFPFDTIKIDRSFLGDLDSNRDVLALVHATMTLLENLGLASVAEGVETAAQVAVLQSLGCRYAQGYYLSRPVKAEALLDSLSSRVLPAESGPATR
jgi:diguanylate cyclase (GGDEF)-like protein/PAS domain S-box-containing protein